MSKFVFNNPIGLRIFFALMLPVLSTLLRFRHRSQ